MKYMIIDGNSLANRAYFGIRRLTAPDGTPTNAVFGFLSVLGKLKEQYRPDIIAAAFDVHEPTFRHKEYAEYKAGRHPMPDDLRVQIPIIKDVLREMSIPVYEEPGYEADDILGCAASECAKRGMECYLVTGDRDSFQLIDDNTSVCFLCNSKTDSACSLYTKDRFEEEYGFEPVHLIDLKALMGDHSDNIPGVPGVGEKTALELIRKYRSIDSLYENLDDPGIRETVRKKLTAGEESARFSYWLATIIKDKCFAFEWSENASVECFKPGAYSMFSGLGLRKFIAQWGIEEHKETEENYTMEGFF